MHECVVVRAPMVFSLFLTCPISVLSVYDTCVAYPPASYDRLAGVTPAGLVFTDGGLCVWPKRGKNASIVHCCQISCEGARANRTAEKR